MMAKQLLVIGLVGQVCAGKSAVAEAFRRRGARVFDADKAVHEIYTRAEVIAQVRALFGDSVLDKQGRVDRKALGRLVFSDAKKLQMLTEQVIFPRTGGLLEQALRECRASGSPALVLDAPTLFEAGRDGQCDHIVFVSAPLERRRAWAKARGWVDGELERRDAKMEDEQSKRARADAVIENSGSLNDVDRAVEKLWENWTAPARQCETLNLKP